MRSTSAIMGAGVALLQVLAALGLCPRQRDLHDLAHLRRPSAQRLDELAKGERTSRLRLESVLMKVLHGARILAAVRRALPQDVRVAEAACRG